LCVWHHIGVHTPMHVCTCEAHTHIRVCVSLCHTQALGETHTQSQRKHTHKTQETQADKDTHTHTHTHTHTADTGHTVAAAEGNNRRARGRMHPRTPILVSLFQFPHPPLYRKLTRSVLDWEGGLLVCVGGWVGGVDYV
jgi:hypothetical protein